MPLLLGLGLRLAVWSGALGRYAVGRLAGKPLLMRLRLRLRLGSACRWLRRWRRRSLVAAPDVTRRWRRGTRTRRVGVRPRRVATGARRAGVRTRCIHFRARCA